MRILIFGGTFNPIHFGHLDTARTALHELDYDTVVFVPTSRPAHKQVAPVIDPIHRYRMVELAINGDERLAVDPCDIERGGTSYTIDTVKEIKNTYPIDGKPGFLLGDDLVDGFNRWRDVETLVQLIDIVIAHRQWRQRVRFEYPHRYLENEPEQVSSKEVRRRIESGEPVSELIPSKVESYIREHNLYGGIEGF